ncbi:MAG TPA: tetratricopeptide repeat protein [Polyangiaceae bacterium]|nr:tetratricopeptide repeat protein [Polyangiaceae bacterium]
MASDAAASGFRDPAFLQRRAARANEERRWQEAIQLCTLGLNRLPGPALEAALCLERARALLERRELARADADCRRSLALCRSVDAQVLLARCLLESGAPAAALPELESTLECDPESGSAWTLKARALLAAGQPDAAVAAAERAAVLAPSTLTFGLRLSALSAAGRHDEVMALAEARLGSGAFDAELWVSLGLSCNARGRSARAIEAFERALALAPERIDANFGLGVALCRQGDFAQGFRYLEHRQKDVGKAFRFGIAPWRGEALAGKSVFVWSEQGLGDIIQFARFVPILRRAAAHLSFFVPSTLVRLFESAPGLSGTLASGHPGFGTADYQTLLLSLPHLLSASDLGLREASEPYLLPERELVDQWRARLPAGPTIALAWQGNPKYAGEPWRSIPFAEFAPLLQQYGAAARFVSLQKNFGAEQLRASPVHHRVLDFDSELDGGADAFVDSAALLSLVDLLITTDTSLVHLAGALGTPTWLLLSDVADWRWGGEVETTIWYPSVRLFRQRVPGNWRTVVQRVCAELGALLT